MRQRAATKIQRAYRLWSKRKLMRMAAEAIQDSERIMLGRQRLDNVEVANIQLGSAKKHYDLMKQPTCANPSYVVDKRKSETQADELEEKRRLIQQYNKRSKSRYGADDGVDGDDDRESEFKSNLKSEATRGKHRDADDEDVDDGEENKLAALNDMLKNRKFAIQQEDEEDFEMFLRKLN